MHSDLAVRRALPLFSAFAGVGLALSIGALLAVCKDVLVPLALAILLSFALSPVVRILQRLGMPRALATIAALLVALALMALWFWFLSGQLADLGAQLPAYRTVVHDKIHALVGPFDGEGRFSRFVSMIDDAMKELSPLMQAGDGGNHSAQPVVVVDDSPISRITMLGGYASPLLSPLVVLVIVFVFTAFLLGEREDLRNRLIKLIGAKDIYRTTEAIDDAGRRVGRMLFAQVALNTIFGVVIALGLALFGVPNPALWGAIASVARFVPYIGVAIGLLPPLLVAFAFDPHWTSFIETLVLFAVAEALAGQVIEPLLYGHSSGLSPVAIVLSTAIWAFIWGPVGLVLATPLTICLVVIGRHAPRLEFLEILLGDSPPLEPHEMFYQRMLAGDPSEAYAQARQFLKARSKATYYDEIALEALRRASIDVARGDLDGERFDTMKLSIERLVRWLGALKTTNAGARRLGRETQAAIARSRGAGEAASSVVRAELDESWLAPAPVAVLYGEHPLDPLAATMFVQTLESRGLGSRLAAMSEAQNAAKTDAEGVALICLCFFEPLTLTHLRAAAAMARRRRPQAKILLCVWRAPGNEFSAAMTSRLRVDAIATSISDGLIAALRYARGSRLDGAAKRRAPMTQSAIVEPA